MPDLQLARFGGKPVHLFVFRRQGVELRFCTGAVDYVNGTTTYTAAQIERSEIKETVEKAKDKLTIKLAYLRDPNAPADAIPATQALGDWFHPYVPADRIDVICMVAHRGDTAAPKVEWMGVFVRPKFGDVELELTCAPYGEAARAKGQGARWQKACWKTVYSTGIRGCGLNRDAFKVDATPTVVGLQLTDSAFGASALNLNGGWFEWTRDDGFVEQRTIIAHAGNTITLLYGGEDLVTGVTGTARPNCQKTWSACAARFSDPENHYGGAMYKPIKNPTDGVSMSWG
jgi:hypothetical protein